MNNTSKEKLSFFDYLPFVIPSIIGITLFMVPIQYENSSKVIVAILAGKATGIIAPAIPTILMVIVAISALGALITKLMHPDFIMNNKMLKGAFDLNWFWTIVRVIGCILAAMVYIGKGPECMLNENTGDLIFNGLMFDLLAIFFFAGFLLPFLTDFGLLEFIGSMLTNVMRPLFGLPGRSSIDCIASFVGDGTIGVALTNKQYVEGYYTAKEASAISTAFSAVSITFCLVILAEVGLEDKFGIYYLAVIVATVVAAIITPKIPPLSRKPDTYYTGNGRDLGENIPKGYTTAQWGAHLAVKTAHKNSNPINFVKNGTKTVLDMWLGVMPVIMAFGTIAVAISEYTSFFVYLGKPFIPLLKLLHVPYAVEASQTMLIGFTDMFLPAAIGASIPDPMTRFIIAGVSVTQLIYLSEVGAVILGSEIPISFKELFIIFLERTLISLPIITLMAHLAF